VGRQFTSSPLRGEDDSTLVQEWQPAMPFEDLWIGEMIGLELAGVPVLLVNIEAEADM